MDRSHESLLSALVNTAIYVNWAQTLLRPTASAAGQDPDEVTHWQSLVQLKAVSA